MKPIERNEPQAPQFRGQDVLMLIKGTADGRWFTVEGNIIGWLAPSWNAITERLREQTGAKNLVVTSLEVGLQSNGPAAQGQ